MCTLHEAKFARLVSTFVWTSDFQQKRIYKFQKIEHLDLTLFFPVDKVAQSIIYTQVLQAKSKHA